MSVADRMAILEKGAIRQIGAPVDVYDNPASAYVARLLGSPVMNVLPATLREGCAEAAGGVIRIAAPAPRGLVDLGMRPEDIRVKPFEGEGRPATVWEVEPLGGFTVVTVDAAGEKLRVLMRGQPDIRPEAKVTLSVDPPRAHYFGAGGATLGRL